MNTSYVGDKKILAIEFYPLENHKSRGRFSLWINNFAIGSPHDDDDFFSTILTQLKEVLNNQKTFEGLSQNLPGEIFALMMHDSQDTFCSTIVHLGESFDEYIIRAVKLAPDILLVLAGSRDSEDPDLYNIISVKVSLGYFINLVELLDHKFKGYL